MNEDEFRHEFRASKTPLTVGTNLCFKMPVGLKPRCALILLFVQSLLCPTLCDPMDFSTPGSSVLHYLLEFPQTHVHWVSEAIQPSHPLSSPSPVLTWGKLQLILITLIVLLTCTHRQKNGTMNLTASPLFSCREKVSIILQLHLGSMKSFSNPSWIQKKYRAAKWARTIPNKMFLPYKGNETMKHQIYFRCGKGYFTFSLNYLLHLSE